MKLILLIFGLVLLMITVSAGEWDDVPTCGHPNDAEWNISSETLYGGIIINNTGTATLCSIVNDIANSSIIGYNATRNEYILYSNIESRGSAALSITDTTLLMNGNLPNNFTNGGSERDEQRINVGGSLNVSNATIKTNNGERFNIWAPSYGGWNDFTIDINDVTIDGGWIYLNAVRKYIVNGSFEGYKFGESDAFPSQAITITSLTIKNVAMSGAVSIAQPGSTADSDAGVLKIGDTMKGDYIIDNLVISNVSGGGVYTAFLTISTTASNSVLQNIHIYNGTSPNWGCIGWLGAMQNLTMENIIIENIVGIGVGIKEGLHNVNKTHLYKNVTLRNITSTDSISGNAIYTYQNMHTNSYPSGIRFENLVIDGTDGQSNRFFAHYLEKRNDFWIFNASLYHSKYAFRVRYANYSLTNVNITTIDNMYDNQWGLEPGTVRFYEILDINVTDTSGNPISNASIVLTPNNSVSNYSVNKWFNDTTTIVTEADGHIPLPSNETGMVAILREKDNSIGTVKTYYNYSLSVSATGYNTNSSIVVTPFTSWYRSDVNVPVNTVNVQLSGWAYNSSHTYTGVKYRYFTDGTRSIIGRNPLQTDIDMGNNNTMTWPEVG